ncbi:MAG: BMP family protein [Anaerolineales bacterium]|nr:BMP family protein [Anaerolineales bacterium]
MKKVYILMLFVLFAGLLLTGCGQADVPAEEPAAAEPAEAESADAEPAEAEEAEVEEVVEVEPFRVALVTPSTINDLAFSQSMYEALLAIQAEMGAENFEIVYTDSMFVVDDAAAAIRDYASQGYDLVLAHGSQYGSSLVEIAPDFPETSFAWGTTVDTFEEQGITNVFAYTALEEEGGYINGVLAASLTESNIIGVVGPIETGATKLYVGGFVAGVQDTNPDIEVNVNWIGSFGDVALSAEAAQTHINAGADVLTGTSQQVVGAIGKAEENGVLWFGSQANQTSLAPSIVVANEVYKWDVILDDMIELIKAGTYGGEVFTLNLENGGIAIEYNPDFELTEEQRALADSTVEQIIAGEITIVIE